MRRQSCAHLRRMLRCAEPTSPEQPEQRELISRHKLIGGVGWEPGMLVASRVVKLSNPPCAIAGIVQGAQCGLRGVRLSR